MQKQIVSGNRAASSPPFQWSGAALRHAREALAISILELSEATKIRPSLIELIEADKFESLPAAAYTRGRVSQIAKALRLPEDEVAQSYLQRMTMTQ